MYAYMLLFKFPSKKKMFDRKKEKKTSSCIAKFPSNFSDKFVGPVESTLEFRIFLYLQLLPLLIKAELASSI